MAYTRVPLNRRCPHGLDQHVCVTCVQAKDRSVRLVKPTTIDPIAAYEQYKARQGVSLKDRALEAHILHQLQVLEELCSEVGPTPLRHRLSEQIVRMRTEIWAFDQNTSPWR